MSGDSSPASLRASRTVVAFVNFVILVIVPHQRLALAISACLLVLVTPAALPAQALPPAQAARFSEGVDALESGKLDAAERAFRDVLAAGGDQAFVHHNLGIVLQQRRRHADAVKAFAAAAARDPSFGPARLLGGASLLALGRPRQAAAMLEHAVKVMPKETAAHLQLADAYERLGNIQGVVDRYRAIVELSPGEPEYAYRLGKAYLRLSQRSFERIQAVDPRSARLQQALGGEYLAQGRPDLALRAFAEAAKRDPTLPEIHLALARIHADEGRWDEAAREIALELALTPESREALELKAQIDAARVTR